MENNRLILAKIDTLVIEELTDSSLVMVRRSSTLRFTRYESGDTLKIMLAEAEQSVRNLERSNKLWKSQIGFLQSRVESLRAANAEANAEFDSLRALLGEFDSLGQLGSKDAVPCERFVNEVGTHLFTHPEGFEVFEVDGVQVHGNLCFKRFRSACTLVENLITKTADSEAEEIERGSVSPAAKKVKSTTIVGMTNWPVWPSAIAVDSNGGVYHAYFSQWTRIATTPSAPADIWYRPETGEVFIALLNGDLYRLEGPGGTPPSPNWILTYDSNVFGQ